MADMLEAEPLVTYLRAHWSKVSGPGHETTQRLVRRAEKQGRVSCYAADRALCRIGVHPAEVYGARWYEEVAA
jgi:hypothetical protein